MDITTFIDAEMVVRRKGDIHDFIVNSTFKHFQP